MMVRAFVMVNIWSKINVTPKDLRTAEDISRNRTQQKREGKLSRRVSYGIRLFKPVSLHPISMKYINTKTEWTSW